MKKKAYTIIFWSDYHTRKLWVTPVMAANIVDAINLANDFLEEEGHSVSDAESIQVVDVPPFATATSGWYTNPAPCDNPQCDDCDAQVLHEH